MRQKVRKLIISFPDTTDAMAAEKYCREHSIPGRLIPLPAAISAGCGLSWCTELEERKHFEQREDTASFAIEGIYEVFLYERKEEKGEKRVWKKE